MILSAIAAKLKQRAKADFRGRHFEAALIVQAVSWYRARAMRGFG
jgi:transposase, IS6 family